MRLFRSKINLNNSLVTMNEDQCFITHHQFADTIGRVNVFFQVISMKDSFYIWIGDTGHFQNLAVGIKSKFDKFPLSTLIMGNQADYMSVSWANKLTQKTGKQVFVSHNLSICDSNMMNNIYLRLSEEMRTYPDKF